MSILFGQNNYAYVPYSTAMNSLTNAISITCWVNLRAAGSLQMFVNRMTSATAGLEWWSLNLQDQALRGLIGSPSSAYSVRAATPVALSLNTWYHCALTFDGTNARLYQDVALIGSGTRSQTFSTDTTGIVIGANAQGAGDTQIDEYMNGYLEDLRIYSRALSVNELACIRNSEGRDYILDNMLLHLVMDDQAPGSVASGVGSIKDTGPKQLHATPYGSCVYGPSIRGLKRQPRSL